MAEKGVGWGRKSGLWVGVYWVGAGGDMMECVLGCAEVRVKSRREKSTQREEGCRNNVGFTYTMHGKVEKENERSRDCGGE